MVDTAFLSIFNYIMNKSFHFKSISIPWIILCLLLVASCKNDEPNISDDDHTAILKERELSIYIYPSVKEQDGIVPRMTIVDNNSNEICTELYDPLQPDVIVYHYMNVEAGVSAFMSASSKGISILEDDPFHSSSTPRATLLSIDNKDIIISSGAYSKQSKSFSISNVKRLENAIVSTSSKTRSIDDINFARELVMKDIISPIANAVSRADDILEKLPFSDGATMYLNTLNDFVLPIAEGLLYSNDEKQFVEFTGEKIYKNQLSRIYCYNRLLDGKDAAIRIYRSAFAAYHDLTSFDENNYDSIQESWLLSTAENYSNMSRQAQESSWKVFDDSKLYRPEVRLVSVDGQSATVCGDFTNHDGRFTVTGYYLYCDGHEVDKIHATLDGSATHTFRNLTKGKKYQATAFATVMGATYESAFVEFFIEGDLELSSYSLAFSDKGGSQTVEVVTPSESWEWKASSGAEWCKITKDNNKIIIDVASTDQNRETVVTVTATSPSGKEQIKTISVSQTTLGDIALFRGVLKMNNKTTYPSKPQYDFTNEYDVESMLLMTKYDNTVKLTFSLPLSGIVFNNWSVSSSLPSNSVLADGYSFDMFDCSTTDSMIFIDGKTSGPDNSSNDFSVKIDLINLCVKITEISRSSGIGYPGMNGPTEYKSTSTLSGTLNYTTAYN